ncbi:MAG: site-2 protease family protein [Promethearchaeota archaeon]
MNHGLFSDTEKHSIEQRIQELIYANFTVTRFSFRKIRVMVDNNQVPQFIPTYEVLRRSDTSDRMKILMKALSPLGFVPFLRTDPNLEKSRLLLLIFPFHPRKSSNERNKAIILFVATLLSVFFIGWFMGKANEILSIDVTRTVDHPIIGKVDFSYLSKSLSDPLLSAIGYTVALLGIILIHEIGHKLVARKYGIDSSLPYFIPLPVGYGTMGAFINQRSPLQDRNALFDLGISGPYTGLAVTFLVTAFGLSLSKTVPVGSVANLDSLPFEVILFNLFERLIVNCPAGYITVIHPIAFAGWVGFLISGLNLLPLGQLDGGHVARSMLDDEKHKYLTFAMSGLMIILQFYLMALIILIFYLLVGHPGPLDDVTSITPTRKIIGGLSFLLALLCLPIPSELYSQLVSPFGL